MVLVGAVAVNALGHGALRQFTLWPSSIDHQTFQLGDGHCNTELIFSVANAKTKTQSKLLCQIFHFAHETQQNFAI